MSQMLKKEKGFTLIEIVLVLAIAGLLLVIVFLAVGGAQKSRRDTQRKNDASRLEAALETAASNSNGVYPANGTVPAGVTLNDPSTGNAYVMGANPAAAPAAGGINWAVNFKCNGAVGVAGGGNRVVAVVVGLEQGGSACYSNE